MYNEYTLVQKDPACRTKVIHNHQACRTRCSTLISVTQSLTLMSLVFRNKCVVRLACRTRMQKGLACRTSVYHFN